MKISGFRQDKVLGEGSYGKVYKTHRLDDNQVYALKVVDLKKLTFREIEDAVNEIRLMASVTSPFIISFYEAFAAEEKKQLCIVTEYAKIGDLRHLIERRKLKNKPLEEEQIWRFLLEILEGLRVLHSCGVVHRDLKSANILISAPDLVKIGDLGIATVLHQKKYQKEMAKTQIGTPLYLAPEIWLHFPYDQKCDIWSLGVLLYEMMTFNFPFDGRTQADLQRNICTGRYRIPNSVEKMYSIELISILRKMLMVDPSDRPSVEDLLNMQSVKSHMDLLNPFLQTDLYRNSSLNDIELEGGHVKLLSTIHVPKINYRYGRNSVNLSNLNLPTQKYDKKQPKIMPIEERICVKNEAPIRTRNRLSELTTPELMLIADQDLWTSNKNCRSTLNTSQRSNSSSQLIKNIYPRGNNGFYPRQNVLNNLDSPNQKNNNIYPRFNRLDLLKSHLRSNSSSLLVDNKYQPNVFHRAEIQKKLDALRKLCPRANQPSNLNPRLNQLNNLDPPSPNRNDLIPRLNQLNKLYPPLKQQPQQLIGRENQVRQANINFRSPPIPNQRKILPAMVDHLEQPKQFQYVAPPVRNSPRIIPTRYVHLYKPCQNNENQDPRWKRKQPSLKRQKDPSLLSSNNNNIFFKQQKDVPWWFGQELKPSPLRKNQFTPFSPRFK